MPAINGKLWQTCLRDGTPVWLLECELRQRLSARVLLAADTSDSCAHERERLKAFFRVLADALELGDSCAMWIIGRREKAQDYRIGHSQDRPELTQRLADALTPVRGGSWLRETLDDMVAEAGRIDPTTACCFFLLVSDGEIFDAETLRQSPRIGFVRLGNCDSGQLGVIARHTMIVGDGEKALKSFLANPPMSVMLEHSWSGLRLVEFSDRGEVVGELQQEVPLEIKNGQCTVRLAYIGGALPQPRLSYDAGTHTWEATGIECVELLPDGPWHLTGVVRALEGNKVDWDLERLQFLADDQAKKGKLSCRNCHRAGQLARRSLFCECDALLVSRDLIKKSHAQEILGGTICFAVEGGKVCGLPVPCDRYSGNHAYDLQEDKGRQVLVLNLYK